MNKLLKQPVNPCMGAVLWGFVVTFIIITRRAITVVTLIILGPLSLSETDNNVKTSSH